MKIQKLQPSQKIIFACLVIAIVMEVRSINVCLARLTRTWSDINDEKRLRDHSNLWSPFDRRPSALRTTSSPRSRAAARRSVFHVYSPYLTLTKNNKNKPKSRTERSCDRRSVEPYQIITSFQALIKILLALSVILFIFLLVVVVTAGFANEKLLKQGEGEAKISNNRNRVCL